MSVFKTGVKLMIAIHRYGANNNSVEAQGIPLGRETQLSLQQIFTVQAQSFPALHLQIVL